MLSASCPCMLVSIHCNNTFTFQNPKKIIILSGKTRRRPTRSIFHLEITNHLPNTHKKQTKENIKAFKPIMMTNNVLRLLLITSMLLAVDGFATTFSKGSTGMMFSITKLDFQPKKGASEGGGEQHQESSSSSSSFNPSYKVTTLQQSSTIDNHEKKKHRSVRQTLQGMAFGVLMYSYEVDKKEFGGAGTM